ncbi:hypothetical protein JCM31826_21190 [Thermaurantimonas aggregans]|uniref:DUF2147 domain-containing protein n=1 Tax=Thermaurantimonas aggregans TaxID=2173829 RepID=A0A401XNP9_9FLAO|nr:DUF2147 domain-containing protein [Thermaurantimonas aggregans]MCX8147677.1 DUF2147 domain-containing protein [Thermaurantimonas aggregans]GCD78637.1 hypothetical protein JCM31826_21190 [Thermaurantimonas aggregans]
MKKILLSLVITWITTFFIKAQNVEADQLIGVWEPSHGKARIKIEKIGEKYYGKIVWLREPIDPVTNQPKVDKNNPDESMRQVPLKGYRILKDFQYGGKGEWIDGTIYDPENGNTYSCVIKMRDENTLDIRGYIGVKALGRTDVWTRVAVKKKD